MTDNLLETIDAELVGFALNGVRYQALATGVSLEGISDVERHEVIQMARHHVTRQVHQFIDTDGVF